MGYSPWGCKDSDRTERLSTSAPSGSGRKVWNGGRGSQESKMS